MNRHVKAYADAGELREFEVLGVRLSCSFRRTLGQTLSSCRGRFLQGLDGIEELSASPA